MIARTLTLCALVWPMAASAQTSGGAVAALLKAADAECQEMAEGGSTVARLEIGRAAVTWLDLDGDELRDDAIVDFNEVSCSLALSLWAGSGGSLIHLVLDDEVSGTFTGGSWQRITFRNTPVVLIGRHGTYCDSFGAAPCIQAVTAQDGVFVTPTVETGPFDWP